MALREVRYRAAPTAAAAARSNTAPRGRLTHRGPPPSTATTANPRSTPVCGRTRRAGNRPVPSYDESGTSAPG